MRKVLYLLIIPLILAGCARVKEVEIPQEKEGLHEVVFHAGWDPETRTELQEDGSVWWSPGDEISLFVEKSDWGGFYKLTSTNTDPTPKVDFVGQVDNQQAISYLAVYPYNPDFSYNGYCFKTTTPLTQIAREGTFDKGYLVSAAVTTDDHLYFQNLCGGIKFSVENEGISRITIKANAGEILAGSIEFFKSLEFAFDSHLGTPSSTLEVIAPNDGTFIPGKYYYAVIPAQTLQDGLSVTYYKGDKAGTFEYHQPMEIKRGVFKRLYNKDNEVTFRKYYSSVAHIYNSLLPDGVDRREITQAIFHTQSDKVTDTTISLFGDIYFELEGTVAHYYTKAEAYVCHCMEPFLDWRKLKELDLTSWDVSSNDSFRSWFFNCLALREINLSSWEALNAATTGFMFANCYSLKTIKFGNFGGQNLEGLDGMFQNCRSLESVDLSSFHPQHLKSTACMFNWCGALKHVDLSHFDTSQVENTGSMFNGCQLLETVDISSFQATSLETASDMFWGCTHLKKLDMGHFDISAVSDLGNVMEHLASKSRQCVIRCCENTKNRLLQLDNPGFNADYIIWVDVSEVIPDVPDYQDPNLYYSTDYSMHKQSKMLKTASVGNGIDIVILGEAYSDRMIADGTYETDMQLAIDAIFDTEPFKTYEEYFNVYMVYLVSRNEVLGYDTALDGLNDGSPYVRCNGEAIIPIALEVTGNPNLSDTPVITIINAPGLGITEWAREGGYWGYMDAEDTWIAWSFMYNCRGDRNDTDLFETTVVHEFGHGFAFLADEYVTYQERISEDLACNTIDDLYYKNVDITSDPLKVKWNAFLADERYANTGLGVFEGGFEYAYGVWRPTMNSIMNTAPKEVGFNAPSREAIYKRINTIANGEGWQYDYETFVLQDLNNIPSESQNLSSPKYAPYPARVNQKHLFKKEESITADGRKRVTIIMD